MTRACAKQSCPNVKGCGGAAADPTLGESAAGVLMPDGTVGAVPDIYFEDQTPDAVEATVTSDLVRYAALHSV